VCERICVWDERARRRIMFVREECARARIVCGRSLCARRMSVSEMSLAGVSAGVGRRVCV